VKSPPDEVAIEPLSPADAGALSRLARRVYGDSYAWAPWVYDPAEVAKRIRSGLLWSAAAFDADRRLLGHMAHWVNDPADDVCEAGMTMVDPDARGARLSGSLGKAVGQSMLERGYLGYLSYPVTMNTVTHRLTRATGGIETGLLLAKLPASTTESIAREPTAGRSSSLVLYQPLKPMGVRRVAMPERYRELISNMFDRCGIDYEEVEPVAKPKAASEVKFRIDQTTAVRTSTVARIGTDLADAIRFDKAAAIDHVDLDLADPAAPWATDSLRRTGFFFGAVLNCGNRGDLLRLQRINDLEIVVETARFAFPEADDLQAYILADRFSR